MARFFANLLPEIALVWALALALFYRRIYIDIFDVDGEDKIIPQWVTVGVNGIFILMPIRTWINKCFSDMNPETLKTYDEVFSRFASDYDQENPVTKKEGFLRVIDYQLSLEKDESKKKQLEQDKTRMNNTNKA
jgi:hypothetical protein